MEKKEESDNKSEKKSEKKLEDASDPQSNDIHIKNGSYRVHVYIEQARALCPSKDKETSDPVFLVTTFGVTKSTNSYDNIGNESIVPIGEHIFIDGENKTAETIGLERIAIQVRDHNALTKDVLLGQYEMDMTYLYSLPDHTMLHQWLSLSNPESEDFSELKGYLKVGISVLHEDDKTIDLCQEEKPNSAESTKNPVYLKPKTLQIIVQVIKADHLPLMDSGGTIDAYCVVKFGGAESITSTIAADETTMSVTWCEEILLPCMIPSVSSSVKVTLMDHDAIGKDELVGSVFLNFEQLRKGKFKEFFWSNFYGAPPLASGDEAEKMNSLPSAASHWRGRLLLRAWIDDKAKTVFKLTQEIKEENFESMIIREFETGDNYELRAQVLSASALPFRSGKYKIKVEWSGINTISTEKETENGHIEWFEVCKRQVIDIPKHSTDLLPDAIVYLIYDDDKICYVRIPANECTEKLLKPQWRQLKAEKTVGKIKDDWNTGFIYIKVYVGLFDENSGLDKAWIIPKPTENQKWKLYAHVFQAKNLPAADKNGLADPYFNLYCAGEETSTRKHPCDMTLNPRWYQTFTLPISISRIEDAPPMIFTLFDYDNIDSDDFLGNCIIQLENAVIDPDNAPTPKWIDLNSGTSDSIQGQILISFSLSSALKQERKFDIMPIFVEKTLSVNILGLRDLKPALGWLPVNKAFLRFDLNSLELPGISQSITPMETQPFESGSDPNILTTLSSKVRLPKDPLYASSLTVTVHDYLFKGGSQPLIGSISIDIGKYFFPKDRLIESFQNKFPYAKEPVIEKAKTKKQKKEEEKKEEEKKDAQKFQRMNFSEVCNDEKLMIIQPTFELKGKKLKEVNQPDPEKYIAIGYNRIPDDGKKYYRYKIDDIFEKTHIFDNLPFEQFIAQKGQQTGMADSIMNLFSRNSGVQEDSFEKLQEAGKLKACIKISNYPADGKDTESDTLSKRLLNKYKCVVRIYILDAYELEQKDSSSLSDPYIRIKLGEHIISDRDNHQEDCINPKIYKHFDIHTTLPGKSILKIQMWDYNSFATDSKIGTTRIDLEDRFFNEAWMKINKKPVETRPLLIKTVKRPQGHVRLWVEIFEGGKVPEAEDISVKPPLDFEARLVIWKSEDVPNNDPEGLSDLYVVAKVNKLPEKHTDTHFRAASGKGSWNWRLKYNFSLPNPLINILTIQIWDKDIVTGDDMISECSVEFDDIAKEAWEDETTVQMIKTVGSLSSIITHKKSNIFWVECKDTQGDNAGKVSISFELIPQASADNNKVGEARDEPNHSPVLGPPVGRFKFSLNPLSMLGQLVGPELKRKVCLILCVVLCCMLLAFSMPIFWTTAMTDAMFK